MNGPSRNIVVVYNPVSGRGKAKQLVDHIVEPVLRLAGLTVDIIATEHAGHATQIVKELSKLQIVWPSAI